MDGMEAVGDAVERVSDPASLAQFVRALKESDKVQETVSASQYLDQLSGFVDDAADRYLMRYSQLPPDAWRLVADVLYSGSIYD